jgi:hypothetical protein
MANLKLNISNSQPRLNVSGANVRSTPIIATTNQTAVNDSFYIVNSTSTFTDPTPVSGKGYIVHVVSGNATIDGEVYSIGALVYRFYNGTAWVTKDYQSGSSDPDTAFVIDITRTSLIGLYASFGIIPKAQYRVTDALSNTATIRVWSIDTAKTDTNAFKEGSFDGSIQVNGEVGVYNVLTDTFISAETTANKVTNFNTIDNFTYASTQAIVNTFKYSETVTISNKKGSLFTVAINVDVIPTVQAIFNSANIGRTSKLKIEMEGNFLAASTAIIPNQGLITIDGTKANITIDNNWNPTNGDLGGSSWIAVFQVGTTASLIKNVEIYGFTVTGTCFRSITGSTTDLANIYFGTTTGVNLIWNTSTGTIVNGTNGNKPKIAFIFGEAVMQNCFFHDMEVRNMGTPITFEGMAKINGTPSENVLIYNITQEKVWVGCQYYGNGYTYRNCFIYNISTFRCYDDAVAICGGSGGISGNTYGFGTVENCGYWNITGFKGGLTGAGAKFDGGKQFVSGVSAGSGILVNCTGFNVNMKTDGSSEHLVATFEGRNPATKDISFNQLTGLGKWNSLGFHQILGRDFDFGSGGGESLNGMILQSGTVPSDRQSINIGSWSFKPRESTTGDNRVGNGLTLCAGGATQGFRNIFCTGKITTYNIAVPINETTPPSGFGVGATLQNVYYNIDIRYSFVSAVTIADCLFNSTNRVVELSYFGQYQGRYGDLNILSGNLSVAGTATASNLSGTNTGDQTLNSLLPTQTGNNGKALFTDGTNATWQTPSSSATKSINVISSNTTAGAVANTDYIYLVSGTTTLTLPTAVTNTNKYEIKNTGVNTVTIATTSSQTIDGSTTAPITPNTSLTLISNNINWFIL